jgi:hypothetical protein
MRGVLWGAYVAGAALAMAAGAAHAGTTSADSALALGANDYIIWSQLGAPNTLLNGPQAVTTVNLGGGITVFADGGQLVLGQQGGGWGGNFAAGMPVLSNFFNGGKITLTFTDPVKGVGAQVQASVLGTFQVNINSNANNGSQYVGVGQSTTAGDNSAIFIGLVSDLEDITEVTFEIVQDGGGPYSGFFGISNVALNDAPPGRGGICGGACPDNPPTALPEPGAWALMILGFGGAGAALRRRNGGSRSLVPESGIATRRRRSPPAATAS